MPSLLGRQRFVEALWESAREGHTVLLYGPVGVGKTAILDELRRRATREGVPCGLSPHTATLGNVTAALADAYPAVGARDTRTQRQIRSGLRLAVADRPGVLMLDHLVDAGTAVKGFLRSLRGSGLGVLLAGDVEHPRDKARLRSFGLAYREVEVPPLDGRHCAALLAEAAAAIPVVELDRRELLRIAHGRPGWILALARRLADARYWCAGRLRLELLRADVVVELKLDSRWR